MKSQMRARAVPILALLLVQLIFGFNFAASKVILGHYPPVLWGGVRLLIAAVLMFLAAFIFVPKEQRRVDKDFLEKTFLFGMIGIAMTQTFFLVGLKYTTTTNSAILNALTPIFTLMFAVIVGNEKLTLNRGLGFCLAVGGAIVIRKLEDFQITSDTFKGDIFTILNCVTLALFFNITRTFFRQNSTFWATAWMFLFSSVVLLAFSFKELSEWVPHVPDQRLFAAMFYNVVLATMVTYFLNSWTLTKVSPSMVALFVYFQPVIAVMNGWLNLGETPTSRTFIAMALIFSGVVLSVVKRT